MTGDRPPRGPSSVLILLVIVLVVIVFAPQIIAGVYYLFHSLVK